MRQLAEDFDREGRLLDHSPQYAYYFSLPENAHMTRHNSLILEPKIGTNGQLRLIESKDCETCHGFMYA